MLFVLFLFTRSVAGSGIGYLGIFGGESGSLPIGVWLLWITINIFFIVVIVLTLGYGQFVDSNKIINLGLIFFVLDIITRYIGFWFDFQGYLAFSILAILGGIILILMSWLIPKWRKKLIETEK